MNGGDVWSRRICFTEHRHVSAQANLLINGLIPVTLAPEYELITGKRGATRATLTLESCERQQRDRPAIHVSSATTWVPEPRAGICWDYRYRHWVGRGGRLKKRKSPTCGK